MSDPTVPSIAQPATDVAVAETTPEPQPSAARSGGDYRDQLGSRRWNAAPLRNPEVDKTDPRIAVAAVLLLAALTLLILVVGYATGFWALPAGSADSGAVAALELLA
jgi:hypothetical protein